MKYAFRDSPRSLLSDSLSPDGWIPVEVREPGRFVVDPSAAPAKFYRLRAMRSDSVESQTFNLETP